MASGYAANEFLKVQAADGYTLTSTGLLASTVITNAVPSWAITDPSWVANINPATIAGSDADPIATIASGGTAAAFTQATAGDRPLLKVAPTGFNGLNTMRFVSTDSLVAATGGASLASDFYIATLFRPSDVSSHADVLSWGNPSNGQRRSLHTFPGGELYFIGESHDTTSNVTLTVNTTYFVEVWYTGGLVYIAVNGTITAVQAQTFSAYSNTTITLGLNPGGTEPFIGDIGWVGLLGAIPTQEQFYQIRKYVQTTWGVAVAGHTYRPGIVPSSPSSTTVQIVAGLLQQLADGLAINGTAALRSGGTGLADVVNAALSVYGSIVAHATGDQEHQLSNSRAGGQNTAAIWNKDAAGISALRWRRTDATGVEMGAVGYCRDNEPFGAAGEGSSFMEASNANDQTKFGVWRLIQTRFGGDGFCASLRIQIAEDGTITFYKRKDLAADTLTPVLALSGTNIVPGASSIATNATDGFLYLPTCAGTPTGTPTAFTGRVPMVYDSTNDILYVYRSGWKKATANILTGVVTWQ